MTLSIFKLANVDTLMTGNCHALLVRSRLTISIRDVNFQKKNFLESRILIRGNSIESRPVS